MPQCFYHKKVILPFIFIFDINYIVFISVDVSLKTKHIKQKDKTLKKKRNDLLYTIYFLIKVLSYKRYYPLLCFYAFIYLLTTHRLLNSLWLINYACNGVEVSVNEIFYVFKEKLQLI